MGMWSAASAAESRKPEREVDPTPDLGSVAGGYHAGGFAADVSHVEIVGSCIVAEQIEETIPAVAEPLLLRCLEADLVAPPHDLFGQLVFDSDALYPLGPAVVDSQVRGPREDIFHQAIVEERHAALDREGHGVAVLIPQEGR